MRRHVCSDFYLVLRTRIIYEILTTYESISSPKMYVNLQLSGPQRNEVSIDSGKASELNALVPGRCENNFKSIIVKLVIQNIRLHSHCKTALR